MWNEGAIQIPTKEGKTMVHYWAKVYDKGSQYGIEGGRISKLTLKENGKVIYNYDRGLDVEPADGETEKALPF